MSKKVFLDGTFDESTWRDKLIPMLEIEYFNPAVYDWSPECRAQELKARENCDYFLYVITPKASLKFEVNGLLENARTHPEQTLFCFLTDDGGECFTDYMMDFMHNLFKLVESNGATVAYDLEQVAEILNKLNEA